VDFINRTLEIPKSKTEAGVRLVPLTPEAYEALLKLRKRAEVFGAVEPSHYVFAAFLPRFRFENRKGERGGAAREMQIIGFDPTRPMRSWRTAWRTLTKKAGLKGLRFHDLRHTAISALGEAGVPDRVIMDLAGHVSTRMLKRYSHIQLEAKRAAIQALSNRPASRERPTYTPPVATDAPRVEISANANSEMTGDIPELEGVQESADVTKRVTKSMETSGVESPAVVSH
jgi:integrase